MKKMLTLCLMTLVTFNLAFAGFEKLLEGFDEEITDTTYLWYEISENADEDSSFANLSWVESPVNDGAKALRVEYGAHNIEGWGGYSKFYLQNPDSTKTFDWSGYDSLSIMYYVETPQNRAASTTFRVNILDVSDAERGDTASTASEGEYYYSFHSILDSEPGWNEIKIALIEDGSYGPSAFTLTGWSGINGNATIDKDKIKSVHFEFSIGGSGTGEASLGTILFDKLCLKGGSKVDVIYFNGKSFPAEVSVSGGWGGGSYDIVDTESFDEGTTAIQWNTPPNDWALFDGMVFSTATPKNMMLSWLEDSIKFKIKADAGLDTLKLVLSDDDMDDAGPDVEYEAFYMLTEAEVGYDGGWKEISIALNDFDRNGGGWNGSAMQYDELMDSTRLKNFKILIGTLNAINKVVYLDQIWIGNPSIDLFAPPPPVVTVTPYPAGFYNLVMWQDVEGETGEIYTVYAADVPFDSIADPNVELLAEGVVEGTQTQAHYLRYPLVEADVTKYYAVTCTDAFGNVGEPGFSSPATGRAIGIPTIAMEPPANFVVDGYFDEWYDSDIMPWVLKPEDNNVAAGVITDSTDLKPTVWIAMDDDYLYVAADIVDDVYNFGDGNWYDQDAMEFFIGLYNLQGTAHAANRRGSEPDYKLQFHVNGIVNEYIGNTINGAEFFYFEGLNPDYVMEAKVPLDSIAGPEDDRFHPVRGMKIPMELYFHDNDGAWDGNLAWSEANTDLAWQSPRQWSYTWYGDTTAVETAIDTKENRVAGKFELRQNYPNPFNPTTTIAYSIPVNQHVTMTVYNMLGQQVETLVNKTQNAGSYTVKWNATNMSSGVYFFRIQSGKYNQTRKMLLMK